MRRLALILALLPLASGALAAAPEEVDRLWRALDMPAVLSVMRDEGLEHGRTLDADMLERRGGARFAAEIARIYDAPAIEAETRALLGDLLQDRDVTAMIDFFEGDLGSRIIALEIEARRAMLEPDVDRAARQAGAELARRDQDRDRLIRSFAEDGDLIEVNVVGALNANFAFYSGMASVGAMGAEMDQSAIISEVWSQEASVRQDVESWVIGYLTLSYQGLTHEELELYAGFFASQPGLELREALFAAYDVLFNDISFQLGAALGAELIGEDL